MSVKPTCMICGQTGDRPLSGAESTEYLCFRCDEAQASLLDDDDDSDGRDDARHLTILSIDVDE